MDYTKDLHELCETLMDEIAEANKKIRTAGGKLSAGDLEALDKLTHALKSVKTTVAMMDEEGYSSRYPMMSYDKANGSYRGGYSRRREYSRSNGMVEELRDLMRDAPDERTRQEFQRFISKLESM